MKNTKFKVGDRAYKVKGYEFPCTIVSVFRTTAGKVRVVAEMDNYGLLHIFNEDQLELSTTRQKREKIKKIELLNFEGPVLMAHRIRDNFVITDEWKTIIANFTKSDLIEFIEGKVEVIDSSGRNWNFLSQDKGARVDLQSLNEFIA